MILLRTALCLVLLGLAACDGGAEQAAVSENGAETGPAIREPLRHVHWYPNIPETRERMVARLIAETGVTERRPARGIVTPHASLFASGAAAADVFARIEPPDVVILLAPSHGDVGARAAVWTGGPWALPGAEIAVRPEIAERLTVLLPEDLAGDLEAFQHKLAHPSEMQLPFLHHLAPDAELVALSFFDHEKTAYPDFDLATAERIADALATVIAELEAAGERVLVIGTTDLTHYAPPWAAARDDTAMLEKITALDADGLHALVKDGAYSICGEVPLSVFMILMRRLGHDRLDHVHRQDSRFVSGMDSVVGYMGGVIWRD